MFFSMFGVKKELVDEITSTLYAMAYNGVVKDGVLGKSPALKLLEETFQCFGESMTKDPQTYLNLVVLAGLVKLRTNISLLFVSSVVGVPHKYITWQFMHRCWRLIKLSLFGPYDDDYFKELARTFPDREKRNFKMYDVQGVVAVADTTIVEGNCKLLMVCDATTGDPLHLEYCSLRKKDYDCWMESKWTKYFKENPPPSFPCRLGKNCGSPGYRVKGIVILDTRFVDNQGRIRTDEQFEMGMGLYPFKGIS